MDKAKSIMLVERECVLRNEKKKCDRNCESCDLLLDAEDIINAYDTVIKGLEDREKYRKKAKRFKRKYLEVRQEQGLIMCKDCKYFEYDHVAKVDGVPLIVAHEICTKWGDGCKTSEDGYCFLGKKKKEEVNGR